MVKNDLVAVCREFHKSGSFVRSLSSSFLVFIAKKEGGKKIKDFRPISLVGYIYKLISKIISKRLSSILKSIIRESQHTFMEGRQIINVVMVADEVVNNLISDEGRRFCVNWTWKKHTIL